MKYQILFTIALAHSACNSDLSIMGRFPVSNSNGKSEIFALSKLKAAPGELIKVSGYNLTPGMFVQVGGKVLALDARSSGSASFVMPVTEGTGNIGATFMASDGSVLGTLALLNSNQNAQIPVMDADASLICLDIIYQNSEGHLKAGSRNCSSSLPLCEKDEDSACVVTKDFRALSIETLDAAKSKMRIGLTLAGVKGTLADCDAGNQAGCVATSIFKTMDLTLAGTDISLRSNNFNTAIRSPGNFEFWDSLGTRYSVPGATNLSAANLKNNVTIFGETGQYPSVAFPLPSASIAADLTNATFNAKVKSSAAFEYWDSAGNHQAGTGDDDLIVGNIKDTVSIFGSAGTFAPDCGTDGQIDCLANVNYKAAKLTNISAWDLRYGKSFAGVSGLSKLNCRSLANQSIFNSDTMGPGNVATTAGTVLDWWDTVSGGGGALPFGWDSSSDCNQSNITDLTTDGMCDTSSDDCVMRDNISGLSWTESMPSPGAAPIYAGLNWSDSVALCDGLTFAGHSDWRLPTVKETMSAFVNGVGIGIWYGGTPRPGGDSRVNNDKFILASDGALSFSGLWTATTDNQYPTKAYEMWPNPAMFTANKTNTMIMTCVR
ncbi:MAG: DUF1566 domain-containing protein [Proteobacteria bacterium]|nr:MAG: DUF1566 domain-containing protein [Pseudomonadota bacterium]